MALYAFDGTWNLDKPGADRDTNVRRFHDAYEGTRTYKEGVGTRLSFLGALIGGMTGAGGRTRVDEMFTQLLDNLEAGDDTIDVVGFSRGAALALHFVNRVATAINPAPVVRFLGLWDTVPSFGVPNVDVNIGWDLDLPDTVQKCCHALALDERRQTFHLHRLSATVGDADQEGRLFEVWFRGVHSDVGGGNLNPGLSSIALVWMFERARAYGLPIDAAAVDNARGQMIPTALPSPAPKYDLIKNRRRSVRWNDQVHASVVFVDGANNPPHGLARVDDRGAIVGTFARPEVTR